MITIFQIYTPPSSPIQTYQHHRHRHYQYRHISNRGYPPPPQPPPPVKWRSSFVSNIRLQQTLRDRSAAERHISLKRCYKIVGPRLRHRRRESVTIWSCSRIRYEYKQIKCSVDICRITYIIFLISTEYLKGLCVIISKLRSGMYIFLLYSLTSAQWSKITELGYRYDTAASLKATYVV